MAGGFVKGLGVVVLVLGALFLVAGAGAAIFGLLLVNQEQQRGAFGDPDAAEMGQTLAIYGGFGAAMGAALLLVGGILVAVGGSMARREILRAVRAGPQAAAGLPPTGAPLAAAPPARTGMWVAAGVVALLLVGALVVALGGDGEGGVLGAMGFSNDRQDAAPLVVAQSFEGRVHGGRAPLLGAINTGQANAIHEMPLEPASYAIQATLNWTVAPPAGASTLTLLLEVASGDAWTEIARAEGGPGLVLHTPVTDVASAIRARVFVGGTGAGDQEYALDVVATRV